MISAEKMEEITGTLINGIFRDDEIMYCEMPLVKYGGKRYDLRDIVATLHNYLYEAVKGERYNYMFHWANKILADCDDDVFEDKEIEKEENTARWKKISPAKIYECSKCGQYVMTDDIDVYKYCHGCGRMMRNESKLD